MAIYGYARVSSEDQDLTVQREALKAAGCDIVREEKRSGAKLDGRDELQTLLDFIREGDTLVVCKLDRLARNTVDMLTVITSLGERGVKFKSLAEPWADTTSPAGTLMLTIMAGVAQFERARIRERQLEGIAKAKADGRYQGGKERVDKNRIYELLDSGTSKAEIARLMDISEMTIYRAVREREEDRPAARG